MDPLIAHDAAYSIPPLGKGQTVGAPMARRLGQTVRYAVAIGLLCVGIVLYGLVGRTRLELYRQAKPVRTDDR